MLYINSLRTSILRRFGWVCVLAALLGGGVWVTSHFSTVTRTSGEAFASSSLWDDPVSLSEFNSLCDWAGVSAETMATAGLSSDDAGALLLRVDSWASESLDSLRAVEGQFYDQAVLVSAMRRSIRRGETEYTPSEITTATSTLQQFQAQRETFRESLLAVVEDQLSEDQIAVLSAIRSRREWNTPVEWKVASLGETGFLGLERCHSYEAANLEQDDQNLLTQTLARSDVILATANRSTRMTSVTGAVEDYLASR